ncbi:MAG: oligosaccharide flippase family protein [bacterium]|nr:oligosaccharide flippase family protein [bacterium]
MIKTFLKDSVIYAIPQFLSRGLSLFLVPLYTRVLSPSDYGSLDLFTVFGSIVNLTIALEISQAVARFYTKEEDSRQKKIYASTALWFTILTYTVFSIIFYFIAESVSEFLIGQKSLVTEFRVGIISIWLGGTVYIVQNQLRWELKSIEFAIMSVVMTLVSAGVTVWLTYFLNLGLNGVFLGYISGFLVGSCYGIYQLRTTFKFILSKDHLKEMLIFSLPLVPASLAIFTSSYIDRIMINIFLDIRDVGLYGIGFRIASIIILVMTGIQGALTPLVFSRYKEKDTPVELAKIFRLFIAFVMIVFAGLTLFANEILIIFTTPEFYEGQIVVIYLIPAILLNQIYIFAPGMYLKDKTKYILYINIFGAIINVILNLVFIPTFNLIGAALASLTGALIVFVIYINLSQKLYNIPYHWKLIIPSVTVIYSIVWFSANWDLHDSTLNLYKKIVTIILVILLVLVFKMVEQKDILKFINIIKSKLIYKK